MEKEMESQKIKSAILGVLKSKKILAITVDCGFDGVKICINGKLFTFPSYIFPIMSEDEVMLQSSKGYDRIIYSEEYSGLYVIGNAAKELINRYPVNGEYQELISNSKKLNVFFSMKESVYLIRSAVSYAIIKYSSDNEIGFNLDDMNLFTIYMNLVLPHSIMHRTIKDLRSSLSENTKIKLNVNKKDYLINLNIKSEHIGGSSQVLSIFNDLIYDANGKDAYDIEELLEMLPAVIIDGGYRTQGLATIKKGASLMVQKVSSYEEYSMIEINKETAKIINDKAIENKAIDYQPIEEYDIDQNIRQKIDFTYRIKDDSVEFGSRQIHIKFSEIKAIKEQVLEKTAKKYCDFLINTYKLDSVVTIIIAGGTGAAYYEMIKKHVSEFDDSINIILLEDTCDNELLSPVYTIVMGSYKSLIRKILKEVL